MAMEGRNFVKKTQQDEEKSMTLAEVMKKNEERKAKLEQERKEANEKVKQIYKLTKNAGR